MKQRLGRIFIMAGIIFMVWPDVMSKNNLEVLQEQSKEYWPIFLIVIGYFFLHASTRRKSHR